MKKNYINPIWVRNLLMLFLAINILPSAKAQTSTIDYASLIGGSESDAPAEMLHVNGYTYILGVTSSADFPVTDGSTFGGGGLDVVIVKYSDSGKVVYAKYIGGSQDERVQSGHGQSGASLQEENGNVYIIGSTKSSDFPVTDGSTFGGGQTDVFAVKLDASGNVAYSTFIGGSGSDFLSREGMLEVNNGTLYFSAVTRSTDYPVTNSKANSSPSSGNIVITKLDAAGSIVLSSYLPEVINYHNLNIKQDIDGNFHLFTMTSSSSITTTNGSVYAGGGFDHFLARYDSNLDMTFSSYHGGSGDDVRPYMLVVNKETYALAATKSSDYPVTDGSTRTGATELVLTKWDASGNVVFSKYLGTNGKDRASGLRYANGSIYAYGVGGGIGFPTTNGSYYNGGAYDIIIAKLNASNGSVEYATYLGGTGSDGFQSFATTTMEAQVVNNHLYIAGGAYSSLGFPVSDGSTLTNPSGGFVSKLNSSGDVVFSTLLDIEESFNNISLHVSSSGDSIYYVPSVLGATYPVTDNSNAGGSFDLGYYRYNLCPDGYVTDSDTLSPSKQVVCINGYPEQIIGTSIVIPGDSQSAIYRNGVPSTQNEVEAKYQWQIGSTATGPWEDIAGAVQKNYSPEPTIVTHYFRRIARKGSCCNNELLSISNVDTLEVNAFTAQTLDAGGIFNICPGTSVTLGASPNLVITNGTAPFTYSWTNVAAPDSALEHPTVSPASSSVYTVIVIDANGCKQIDQAIVNPYRAEAGDSVKACGDSVRIEGVPLPGVSGVTYAWTPTTGMGNPNVAQPNVMPSVPTEYKLTMTFPVTGGGTCVVTDSTEISPVPAPTTTNIAGADQTICFGMDAALGTPAEAGYTYTWSPGIFLSTNSASQTTYDPGTLTFPPNPDPATYTLTANRDGCFFADAVTVSVINADAGIDGCGPRYIGKSHRSDVAELNETFQWKRLSGDANMLEDSNRVRMPISAGTVASTFVLITKLNGVECADTVVVPACGCFVDIEVNAPTGCPNYDINPVKLSAFGMIGSPSEYNYSWTPTAGITDPTKQSVMLTDNIARTYTVTVTSKVDPTFTCSKNINANPPGVTFPVFNALDTAICLGNSINIGNINVAGYSYEWKPELGLTPSSVVSNPSITPQKSAEYYVEVTDVVTGCRTIDTATIVVRAPFADAGPDYIICNAQTVSLGLGSPALMNHAYAWTPGTGGYTNGTDSTFAQPDVIVAITTSYIVTATDTITGCSATDTALITVDATPTLADAPDIDLCFGESKMIGLPLIGGATYTWSPNIELDDNTKAQPITSATSTRTYTLTANFLGGCSAQDNVIVTVHNPTVSLTDAGFCPSNGAVSLGSGVPTGLKYSWSPKGLVSDDTLRNPTTTNPPPSATTVYTLEITDAFGCKATDDMTITPYVDQPNAGDHRALCLNETTTLGNAGNTAPAGNLSYAWTPSTGLDDPTSITPTFTPTATGTYTFVMNKTDASIPCTGTDTVIVNVVDYKVNPMGSTTICENSSTPIGLSTVSQGAQYFWSPGSSLDDSTIAMPTASPSSTTTYTLTSVGLNGCVATGNVTVGVNPIPSPVISISSAQACVGAPVANFNPSVSPAATNHNYLWSPNDGTVSDIYALNPDITPGNLGNKTYNLKVTDTAGCSSVESVDMEVINCLNEKQALGDYVWLDTDKDGIQDLDEVGVAGVTVDLYDNGPDGLPNTSDDVLVGSTVTDAYGKYYFDDIQTGDYNLGFTLLSNYTFTNPTGSGDNSNSTNSDVNTSAANFGRTGTFSITSGEIDTTIDVGLVLPTPPTATIGDRIWMDNNQDGEQNVGEPGIAGVMVQLLDASGNVVASTLTDASGNYLFKDVPPGTYSVKVIAPIGSVFTTTGSDGGTGSGTDSETDSDVNSEGVTPSFTVAAGDNYKNVDAGIVTQSQLKSSLGDFVWYDQNQDGIQDADEVGIEGVMVILRDSIGNPLDTTFTDISGKYSFNNLEPATYSVRFVAPVGYSASPADSTVTLWGEGTDMADSDADPVSGESGQILLGPGRRNSTVDAGFFLPGTFNSIGNKVWYDTDQDGVQDAGEVGAAGVTVSLLDGSGNPVNNPATGKPYVVMTDADGNYKFVGLPDGDYQIQFDNLPVGFTLSPSNTPGDNNDDTNSDADLNGRTPTFNLAGGENETTVDAGIYAGDAGLTASLGNKVWYDLNNDGIQDPDETGVAGITVILKDYGPDGLPGGGDDGPDRTTTTNAQGEYLFTNLPAGNYAVEFSDLPAGYAASPKGSGTDETVDSDGNPISGGTSTTDVISLSAGEENLDVDLGINKPNVNSIGNYVWVDVDGDGQQGAADVEPPIPGIQVTLLDASGEVYDNDPLTPGVQPYVTTTDASGKYLFTDLPDGTYSVQFTNLPEGFDFTTQNSGAAGTDSDAGTDGKTATVTVGPGNRTDLTLDAGINSATKAMLGNFVWSDDDGDGIQDPGEKGIAGVLVTLYDAGGNAVATTVTDANGKYLFPNLDPGTYSVGFSNLPEGSEFTGQDAMAGGGTDASDSDVDPATGRTATITLAAGDVNLSLDAGVKPPATATVGNYVWFDINQDGIQDADEPPFPGVTVTIKDANGSIIGTTITDGEGKYLFTNVPPGTGYTIEFNTNIPDYGDLSGYPVETPYFTIQDATNAGDNGSIVPVGPANYLVLGISPPFDVTYGSHTRLKDVGVTSAFPYLLPVEFLSFTAVKSGSYSLLNWKTASESNNSHFMIERLNHSGVWISIGTVNAKGNSITILEYSFVDLNPRKGINYYRIRQVDKNGEFSYSNIRNVTFADLKGSLVLFPNPAKNYVTIGTSNDEEQIISTKVISVDGRIHALPITEISNTQQKFNTSNLAQGTYIVQVKTSTGQNINLRMSIIK